jgi:hypothetical protein
MLIIEYKMTTIGKNIAKVYSIKNAMNIQANRFMAADASNAAATGMSSIYYFLYSSDNSMSSQNEQTNTIPDC